VLQPDPRDVFVVHGRDKQARDAVLDFLRAIDLHPLDWEELVGRTRKATPYMLDVLRQAFERNQAAVILFTPDDGAVLHEDLRGATEPSYETEVTGQPRPNVLLEAGMALALQPDRTVIIEIGGLRPVSDIAGLNVVRFDGTAQSLMKIAQRLEIAGCAVKQRGTGWLDTGRFTDLKAGHRNYKGPA
jgi:predicted nucleotide-binding protein